MTSPRQTGPSWLGARSRDGGIDEVPLPSPDECGGRLWLCGKHHIGPDPTAAMDAVGASCVLCLNEEHELDDRYPEYVRWLRASSPGSAVWHPVPDLHAPHVDDAVALVDDVVARLREGDGVIIQCGAGIGRAGTIAAAVLMRLGASHDDALATVAAHRPMAGPEAGVQRELMRLLAVHFDDGGDA